MHEHRGLKSVRLTGLAPSKTSKEANGPRGSVQLANQSTGHLGCSEVLVAGAAFETPSSYGRSLQVLSPSG